MKRMSLFLPFTRSNWQFMIHHLFVHAVTLHVPSCHVFRPVLIEWWNVNAVVTAVLNQMPILIVRNSLWAGMEKFWLHGMWRWQNHPKENASILFTSLGSAGLHRLSGFFFYCMVSCINITPYWGDKVWSKLLGRHEAESHNLFQCLLKFGLIRYCSLCGSHCLEENEALKDVDKSFKCTMCNIIFHSRCSKDVDGVCEGCLCKAFEENFND